MTADVGTVAQRPEPRTVTVHGEGRWEGWEATARADFPARILFDLSQTDDLPRFYAALDSIVIEHNLPGTDGELAPSMADVDPRQGAQHISSLLFEAIGNLPKL